MIWCGKYSMIIYLMVKLASSSLNISGVCSCIKSYTTNVDLLQVWMSTKLSIHTEPSHWYGSLQIMFQKFSSLGRLKEH